MIDSLVKVARVLVVASALIAVMFSTSASASAAYTDPFDVTWNTPSTDAAGSMPMGNGELGINLWADANGNLNFYLSRTDSFSEISRLLKVGQVRVTLSPNPFAAGQPFLQQLHLHDGVCEITAGQGAGKVTLKIFVDADEDVVNVIGQSASPVSVKASIISWRNAKYTLTKKEEKSAWSVHDAPYPLTESADLFPDMHEDNAVMWYHRNETSVVPSTLTVQSLSTATDKVHDPLLHRTFGGCLSGVGFKKTLADHSIATPSAVKDFALQVFAPCLQCDHADDWTTFAAAWCHGGYLPAAALEKTSRWWHDYWDRSWVLTDAGQGIDVPVNSFPLRVGFDSNQQNKFPGEISGAIAIGRNLTAEEITALAAAPHDQPSPIKADLSPDYSKPFTLTAWIKPEKTASGRIFDKLTAGTGDGFLFDNHPGDTLRLIVGETTLVAAPHLLSLHQWHHAAATVNPATGALKIYLDGKLVAEKSTESASPISRGYILQRYVQACEARGRFPIKFNGGIFTVEPKQMGMPFDPDYRSWGDCFWWQNTRHMYHPMMAAGDVDMTDPLFTLYTAAAPIAAVRTQLYHHCEGVYFPETMSPWGTYSNGDYGWNRNGKTPDEVQCQYWRYAWNQGPELVALMLDRWDYTNDRQFAQQQLLPMARAVLQYFDTRFKRDSAGKLVLDPTQSIETYWYNVLDDMPSVAGLIDITDRLSALPADVLTKADAEFFNRMRQSCPAVPTQAINGRRELAPARQYDKRASNCENPELYAVWPFRLYGLGKPGLDDAITAYRNRKNHLDVGWGYDGNCAALLGLGDESARILRKKCENSHAGYRWPATWGPNFDWLPDQNHGGNLLETTQLMLLQCDGSKIRLLPAWPARWNVRFKLHATGNTTVECDYRDGKVERLIVTPPQRLADVILPGT